MPENFAPNDDHKSLASQLAVNLDIEFGKFIDYHVNEKGSKFVDWNAALRNWIRNSYTFRTGSKAPAPAKQGVYRDTAEKRDYTQGVTEDGKF